MNSVLTTRNFTLNNEESYITKEEFYMKTRNFAFSMMNFAARCPDVGYRGDVRPPCSPPIFGTIIRGLLLHNSRIAAIPH